MVEEIVGSAVLKFQEALSGCGGGRPAPGGWCPHGQHLIEQGGDLMENSVSHGKHTSKVEVSAEEEKDRVVFLCDNDSSIRPFELFEAASAREMRRAAIADGIWASVFQVCMSMVQDHQGDMKARTRKEEPG